MISYNVTCHVTTVTYLFIVQINKEKKKRNIKSRKINKRKKMLVFKHTITILRYVS